MMHQHPPPALDPNALWWPLLAVAVVGYLVAVHRSRRRTPWPRYRTGLWIGGLALVAVAVGPLAARGHGDFRWHMAGHVALGMAAPIALVMAAPITVLLRALPAPRARQVSWLLRTAPVRILAHPVTAAILNAGGLRLLYGTGWYAAMHRTPGLHLLVHLHVLLAGYLFTATLLEVDPAPARHGWGLRTGVLIAFLAAHAILAKYIYANPPAGVTPPQAEAGAQLMYYAGDWVDLVLIVLFCHRWYRRTAPRGAAAPVKAR